MQGGALQWLNIEIDFATLSIFQCHKTKQGVVYVCINSPEWQLIAGLSQRPSNKQNL